MPLGRRVNIKVIDKTGKHLKTILRCLRSHAGTYTVLYEKREYKVEYIPHIMGGVPFKERCIYLR